MRKRGRRVDLDARDLKPSIGSAQMIEYSQLKA